MSSITTTSTGVPAIQLAAALTEQQWADLEQFAEKRLRRSARTRPRQRALALFCGRSLVHTAVERFALGDIGFPGGRRLSAKQRVGVEPFINALRGAINSMITHALERAEFAQEHVGISLDADAPDIVEPHESGNLAEQLELRDLEHVLFNELERQAGEDPCSQAALKSLRDDCLTGHVRGEAHRGVDVAVKNQLWRLAQQKWKSLSIN